MNRTTVQTTHSRGCPVQALLGSGFCPTLGCLVLLILGGALFAQTASQTPASNSPSSIRATHLLGFADARSNAKGTLSIQDNALQFQENGKPAVRVTIASVQDVFLGGTSQQVGGLPMTIGKTAAPFGGGRVVSLFAHKKYDTLTFEYVDANGAVHGAIFQLNKGQGEALGTELAARGVRVNANEVQPKQKTTAEVSHESK
jgi:hypothetical protein